MFADSLLETSWAQRTRGSWTTLTSFGLQVLIIGLLLRLAPNKSSKIAVAAAVGILIVASYASAWRTQPVSFREAWVNSRSRIAFETELASSLNKLPHDASLLMYLGDHVGALQRAGIP